MSGRRTPFRSLSFRAAYWLVSIVFTLTAVPLLLVPGRKVMAAWISLYGRTIRFALRALGGIAVEVRGKEHVPDGPCVIAAKHQSWGDALVMASELKDLAFVAGDHMERFPFVGGILRKIGAIVVDNCGGAQARARLVDRELKRARADGRRILIYPEGHLAPAGQRFRYKRGVFHMYEACGCPAVPVATNLGLFWPQESVWLSPGRAVVEFLPAIPPGLDKAAFMARLEDAVETRTLELCGAPRKDGEPLPAPLPDPRPEPRTRRRLARG